MNKKLIYLFFFITILFTNNIIISAKECKYKYEGDTITITTKQDESTNEITIDYNIPEGIERDKDYNFIEGKIFTNENQCLSTITVCRYDKNDYNLFWDIISLGGTAINTAITGEKHLALFGSSLDPSTVDSAVAGEFDSINSPGFWQAYFWTGDSNACTTAEYFGDDADKMKENGNFINYCDKFLSMYSKVATGYQEYGKCLYNKKMTEYEKSSCKSRAFTKINKELEKLKNTCNSILQHSSISVRDGCAKSCLGANKTLETLKEKYGLDVKDVNDCSISNKLAIWVANIIRWVKYIIPVFIIILGSLDFMKATGSSKDDEMKKAQGRFIRRLVAAALIFIAPFIIQFIIEKMGFAANGCGIIDL